MFVQDVWNFLGWDEN